MIALSGRSNIAPYHERHPKPAVRDNECGKGRNGRADPLGKSILADSPTKNTTEPSGRGAKEARLPFESSTSTSLSTPDADVGGTKASMKPASVCMSRACNGVGFEILLLCTSS